MATAPPVVSILPAAPNRSDAPADFSTKADAFVAALPPMVSQENALATWMNSTAGQVSTDAANAHTDAARAEAVDTELQVYVDAATAQANRSQTYANNAAASATAAEGAPGSIGNLALIQAMALLF